MKIGILTFHRAHNYGAVLQCYALQQIVSGFGHDVEVIDYIQPHIDSFYKSTIDFRFLLHCCLYLKIRTLIKYTHTLYNKHIAKKNFDNFRRKRLHCSKLIKGRQIPQIYERYIIGSDQVWGLHCCGGYEPIYFGDFERDSNSRIYGFSISSNGDFFDHFDNNKLKEIVDRFTDISFREKTIRDRMQSIIGVHYCLSYDPTLLSNQEMWESLINKKWSKFKYIVLYHIRGSRFNSGLIEKNVLDFANRNKLKVVDLSKMTYPVCDFISSIKYAQCVFTSSFHATVFSIIFGTPFYSYTLNDGHDIRYTDLLNSLDLKSHLIPEDFQISSPLAFDKKATESLLADLKNKSYQYLEHILS